MVEEVADLVRVVEKIGARGGVRLQDDDLGDFLRRLLLFFRLLILLFRLDDLTRRRGLFSGSRVPHWPFLHFTASRLLLHYSWSLLG